MHRRQFIRDVLLWSAGVGMAAERPAPLVSVARSTDYPALVAQVLEPLGSMTAFVRPGDRVVVKPNIGWDRSPEQGANTHPQVVRTVVEAALAAGAARVLVFDRTCNEPRRCYASSGIEAAVRAIGDRRAVIEHADPRKFVPVEISRGQALTR